MSSTVPTEHDKREWSRLAGEAYASDRNAIGHRYSAAATLCIGEPMPVDCYDYLQGGYRAWLVSGWQAFDETEIGRELAERRPGCNAHCPTDCPGAARVAQ